MAEATATASRSVMGSLVRRPAFWFGIFGSLVAAAMGWALTQRRPPRPELPVLSTVPAFSFTDQSGAKFDSADLRGRVWVANFIFTRCPTICPPFSAKMAAIQDRSAATRLALVSFTVDPEWDTPEKLKEYGEKYHANFSRWSFVTGQRPDLERVIVKGMMQPMDKGDGQDLASVVHGSYFVLVDGAMKVRGYYKFDAPGAVDLVVNDALDLLRR